MIDISNSKFIEKYREEMVDSMMKMNPSWDKHKVEKEIDKIIENEIQFPEVEMDNNYTKEHKQASLLSVFDWAIDRKPIIAGNGTFYKNQYEAINPVANMLDDMLKSRKAYKKQMFKIDDVLSKEYKDLDRQQANEKINVNSYYGASGMPSSAFYSTWSGPATTLSAQSVISTTETTFESFVADNYLFLDLTECVHWMNVILEEDIELDPWINRNITEEMVYDRLSSKFIKFKSSYEEPLRQYLSNLRNEELVRIYYKNNLIQFMKDHEYMRTLHQLIFLNVKNLRYVDEYTDKSKKILNPYWRDEIRNQYGYDDSKFKEPKDWNKFVNKQFFMDPNDVPESIKEYVETFSNLLFKYVYVRYLSFDRIYRLKNFKRKVVTVIDTDSNILSLDTWVNYILDEVLLEDYGRTKDNNVFIIINTITYAITQVVTDILLTYGKFSNVPKEYRARYNMKNEFMFGKLVIGKTKKRYLSKIILREGNLNNPPKYDIKGFD